MATRTISVAGGNWDALTAWDEGAVPTAADEVVARADGTSGSLTVNIATAYCRSMDLSVNPYSGTFALGTNILRIGDGTAPASGIVLRLGGTCTFGASSRFTFISSAVGTQTIYTANKTTSNINFEFIHSGIMQFQDDCTIAGVYIQTGEVDFNGKTFILNSLACQGATAKTVTFGSSIISLSQTTSTFSNAGTITITANTATITFIGSSSAMTCPDATNWNGLTLKIIGAAGTNTFSNSFTCKNFIIEPTTTKTITITSGKTLTVTDYFICDPTAGKVTMSRSTTGAAYISKSSGTVNLYQLILNSSNSPTFTGGATWNLRNGTVILQSLCDTYGLVAVGGDNFIDGIGGSDTNWPFYGFWKVAYTGATGTCPVEGEILHGETSGSTGAVSHVNPYEWNVLGAGTIYLAYKSAAFVAETIHGNTGDGHLTIAADFVTGAMKTIHTDLASYGILDVNKVRKSLPVSSVLGTGTWTPAPELSTDSSNPYQFTASSITSSTNATPIVITKNGHGIVTNDIVFVTGHTSNVGAHGAWIAEKVDANQFKLLGSVGTGVGGANGTFQRINCGAVTLDSAPDCIKIDNCEQAWTTDKGVATLTTSITGTVIKEGYSCMKIGMPAAPVVGDRLAWFNCADVNLSTCDRINFYFKIGLSSTSLIAGNLKVCLHDNDTATNIVDTFLIPAIPYMASYSNWYPLTILKSGGGTLGASIKSISIHIDTSIAGLTGITRSVYIDHIFASTSTGVNLQHLISKSSSNQGGVNEWHAIQSINGKVIVLEGDPATAAATGWGYSTYGSIALVSRVNGGTGYTAGDILTVPGGDGTGRITVATIGLLGVINTVTISTPGKGYTIQKEVALTGGGGTGAKFRITELGAENVTTYIRETIKTTLATTYATQVQKYYVYSFYQQYNSLKGGYDITTGSQDGESFYDGLAGTGYGLILSLTNTNLSKLSFARYYNNVVMGAARSEIEFLNLTSGQNLNADISGFDSNLLHIYNCNEGEILFGAVGVNQGTNYNTIIIDNLCNSSSQSVSFEYCIGNNITLNSISNCYQAGYLYYSYNNVVEYIKTWGGGNTSGFEFRGGDFIRWAEIWGFTGSFGATYGFTTFEHFFGYTTYVLDRPVIISKVTEIYAQTATAGGTGIEWLLMNGNWTSNYRSRAKFPLPPGVPCKSGSTYTVSIYVKKESATGVYCDLVAPANELTGVSEQRSSCPNDTVRNLVSISFSPSEDGIMPIFIEVWGEEEDNVIFDDFSVTVS